MSNESSGGGGLTLGGAVFIVFLTLKLLGQEPVASWSWWWVTSPLWIVLAIAIPLLILWGIFSGIRKDWS